MLDSCTVKVIIPALNEALSIGKVLADVPAWVDEIIVVDNGSTDHTAAVAAASGARVVTEPCRGYGQACLAGLGAVGWCDVVVFLDGDYSDFPEQMDRLVRPIVQDRADMVLGRRVPVHGDKLAFTTPQRFGTALACHLVRLFWGRRYRDMGPFRAVRWSSLQSLQMQDKTYGWTIEMQIKALLAGLRVLEVPVDYRSRIGTSKISGTIRGVWGAGTKILGTIGKYVLFPPKLPRSHPDRLIVFARWPIPGQTKTRLIPALGPLGAAELQRRMTVGLLDTARTWAEGRQREIEVWHEGGSWRQLRRWLGPGLGYRRQKGSDLGDRMSAALKTAFQEGCRRAVLVGTDCPHVTPALLDQAMNALDHHDLVVGPTHDGGYWLIGMKRPLPVFGDIAWSTDRVLAQTLKLAEEQGVRTHLLPRLGDVDLPGDLSSVKPLFAPKQPVLSVVIPALNECQHVEESIRSAAGPGVEIIVADGGSTDGTQEIAAAAGARVVQCSAERAHQQNQGAAIARGEILLFLHADTLLPPGYAGDVFQAMLDRSAVGGGFLWQTDVNSPTMRAAGFFVRLRTVYGHEPWGDQAIFVRRSAFQAVGGFPDVPIAEDWSFIKKLSRLGHIVHIEKTVTTSARRWQQIGTARTFLINRLIILGCQIGIPRSLLAELY